MEISLSMSLYFTYSILQGNFTGLFQIQFASPVTSRRWRNFLNRYYLPSSATACQFLLSFLHFYNLPFSLGILMFCTKQVSCDRQERLSMPRDIERKILKPEVLPGFSDSRYHTSLIFLQRSGLKNCFRMLGLRAKGTNISLCLYDTPCISFLWFNLFVSCLRALTKNQNWPGHFENHKILVS